MILTNYTLVSGATAASLEQTVNALCARDWQVQGGLVYCQGQFWQAMVHYRTLDLGMVDTVREAQRQVAAWNERLAQIKAQKAFAGVPAAQREDKRGYE